MMTFFRIATIAAVALYGAAGLFGWEFGPFAEENQQPISARNSPGGHRSSSFWFVGLHGGK